MKRFLSLLCVAAFLFDPAHAADRVVTTTTLDSSVRVNEMRFYALPDGGCSTMVIVTATLSDGGQIGDNSATVDLAGANRTTCLNAHAAGLTLFKNTSGF